MLDLIVYSHIIGLFVTGIAPVLVDVLREYREIRARRQR